MTRGIYKIDAAPTSAAPPASAQKLSDPTATPSKSPWLEWGRVRLGMTETTASTSDTRGGSATSRKT